MAPAIQNTLGEEFYMPAGTDVTKKIAAAMHRLGGYAFTTDFSADLTIMEEGTEFIDRVTNGGVLPMMTSCCPGWIKQKNRRARKQLLNCIIWSARNACACTCVCLTFRKLPLSFRKLPLSFRK